MPSVSWRDPAIARAAIAPAIAVRKDDLATANLTRIIDATLRLYNKKGFHSTTVRDLAKASGLSMGGVYSYVASKEALVSMLLARHGRRFHVTIPGRVAEGQMHRRRDLRLTARMTLKTSRDRRERRGFVENRQDLIELDDSHAAACLLRVANSLYTVARLTPRTLAT